ncbi:MAG: arginine--tRNA ligase [Desulfurococcaceae archaeon]
MSVDLSSCILEYVVSSVTNVLGIDEEIVRNMVKQRKLKISPTPESSLGDYGIALHPLLKDVNRSEWGTVGELIKENFLSLARDKCWVEEANFINGYLNVRINYTELFKNLVEKILTGKVDQELYSTGKGLKVVVEHTSANPVHPLHIGSGRNSVIGDVYARLLRKLGFNVETRFYVNDLGRQVATLVYGVGIVKSHGICRPDDIKVDHWYGVIYALTNIIIELDRLRDELYNTLTSFRDELVKIKSILENSLISGFDETLLNLYNLVNNIVAKSRFKHNIVESAKTIYRELRNIIQRDKDNETARKIYELIAPRITRLRELIREYLKYLRSEKELAIHYPHVYKALRSGIKSHVEAENFIRNLMERAEKEDPEIRMLFRSIAEDVLTGFKETLSNLGIFFDGFDFESSDEILRKAHLIVEELLRTQYTRIIDNAVEVNLDLAMEHHEYIRNLFYPDRPGRFIVRRSDGTTLYVTRDIAYTIFKFKELGAKKVYNVIAVEQSRAQKQLKACLYILGYLNEAENLHHFSYEFVHLKDMRMSGRRGVYYSMDELLVDMERSLVSKYVSKNLKDISSPNYGELIRKLAVSNIRALLISVEPGKVLSFDPSKIGEFEHGITITYSNVRAQSILRKLWELEPLDALNDVKNRALDLFREFISQQTRLEFSASEKRLMELLSQYEKILVDAYNEMKPNKVFEYAVSISLEFNKFYEKHSVIGESDEVKRAIRVLLTTMVLIVLTELMNILGMPLIRKL